MIELNNLVELHDNPKSIRRHRRILEELFYLCINESFIDTVVEARDIILGMTSGIDVVFPISNKETAIEIRNEYLIRNDDYQTLLIGIGEKHNYYHPSFTRNYWRVESDASMRNRFNILENILFLNNPLPDINQSPVEHFNNRSGYVEIAHDEIEGPYIRMHFDLGTTHKEIIDIIDKVFPETADLQNRDFNISKKQYRQDTSLRKKKIIDEQTKLNRNDTQIARELDVDGSFGEENIAEQIRSQRTRMQNEVERYNSYG